VTSSDDEQLVQIGSKDEEAAVGTTWNLSQEENDHAGEHPGDLVPARPLKSGGMKRPDLSRQSTRTDLPGVEQVLKRTLSLSGASVHGGG